MKSNQTLYVYASSDSISKESKQNCGRVFFFWQSTDFFQDLQTFFLKKKDKYLFLTRGYNF